MDWIKCSERMPEKDGEYLVVNDGRFEIAEYSESAKEDGYFPFGYEELEFDDFGNKLIDWTELRKITHWMPLPDPPKEVQHVD